MLSGDDHLLVRLARDDDDIRAAQRLRYEVFVQEMGAEGALVDHRARLETDRFDAHCQHLILVDNRRDSAIHDHVVGVYRMLDGNTARHTGGFYSKSEFDLSLLTNSDRKLLELGRSCVHRNYRNGMALYRLWHGLGTYVTEQGIDVLFGVASFAGAEPSVYTQSLSLLHHNHLAPGDLRVSSRASSGGLAELVPAKEINRRDAMLLMPGLIKAYLRIGGFVGQGYFVDHEFNTTDVCLILDTARMTPHQRRMYGGGKNGP